MRTTLSAGSGLSDPPLHGFRGEAPPARATHPRGLTVALSREAGARGTTIARKLGELLGWQVFDQELLDYLLVDESGRAQLLADVPAGARAWADAWFDQLRREHRVNTDPETEGLVRVVLAVAARGDAVVVGRGAGFVLPAETTLHVRVVAPFESRVSYIAQTLRLSRAEAAAEVRHRDDRRARFLTRTLLRDPPDATAYDVLVNSTRLGVEAAAQVIGWAVRTKQQFAELAEPPGAASLADLAGS